MKKPAAEPATVTKAVPNKKLALAKAPVAPKKRSAIPKAPAAPRKKSTLAKAAAVPRKKSALAKVPAAPKPIATGKAPGAPSNRKSAATQPSSVASKQPVQAPAAERPAKAKLVRDSFTMPQQDFSLIGVLKERALNFRRPAKKSELLRAGLHALSKLPDLALRVALDTLLPLKAGRPKK